MKDTIPMFSALAMALPVCAQILGNPELIVQKDDLHFAVLAEHQAQIKDRYDQGKLILPSFGSWVRVESESAAQLFPKLSFYSISWSESLHPDAKQKVVGMAMGLEKTVSVNTDTGMIETELFCSGNYERFGKLLVENGIVLESPADVKRVWKAFCEIHHRHWQDHPIKKVSDTMWHLGISSYDQTISTTDKTKTVVTRTHYMQVVVDRESKRIRSWESKVDASNERTLMKE